MIGRYVIMRVRGWMIRVIYKGFIEQKAACLDLASLLFLSTLEKPLVEELDWIKDSEVTIRYWICDKECSRDEANEDYAKQIMGSVEYEYGAVYSELTGYLWTNEELMVGGHDLLDELLGNVGKYLILEVEVV